MDPEAPQLNLDQTLRLAAQGDQAAWRALVETYSRRIFGLVVRQCRDRELAEEITQATFVQVVGHIGRYRERGKFEPWLFRIAMNRLRDEMRRRKRQAQTMDMSEGRSDASAWAGVADRATVRGSERKDDPMEQASRAEQVQRLREMVAALGEADREILHLRHTAGLSFAQIAQTLGEPLGTVLARGHRALAKLKKLMEEGQA